MATDRNGNPLPYSLTTKFELVTKFELYPEGFAWFRGYSNPPSPGTPLNEFIPSTPGGTVREAGCWPHRIPIVYKNLDPQDSYDQNKGYGFIDPTYEEPITQEEIDLGYPALSKRKYFTYLAGFEQKTFQIRDPETEAVLYSYQADVPIYICISDIETGVEVPGEEYLDPRWFTGKAKAYVSTDYGINWDETNADHWGIPDGNFSPSNKNKFAPGWEYSFSAGDGRIVVPNVYNKQYPLNESKWQGTKVIAGFAPANDNFIYQNEPYQGCPGREVRCSQVYIGNDEVLYYDCIHIKGVSYGTWREGFPSVENGQIRESNFVFSHSSNILEVPGNHTNYSSGNGWMWVGPDMIINASGNLVYQDANTHTVGGLPVGAHEAVSGFGTPWQWKYYNPELGEYVVDLPPYTTNHGFMYWWTQQATILSYSVFKSTVMSTIERACRVYVDNGGVSYAYAGINPGGSPVHDDTVVTGPSMSCTVNVIVKGKIQGNKVVPIEAYPLGYQWSGNFGGWHWNTTAGHQHHDIGYTGVHISKDQHNTGRRGVMVLPKMALSPQVIIGQCWDCYGYGIDTVDPTRPPGYDNGEISIKENGKFIEYYGWLPSVIALWPRASNNPENDRIAAGYYNPVMPPTQTSFLETVDECGSAQYYLYQKTKWHKYLCLSLDGGRTWGPYLEDPNRVGQIKGPDYDWGGVPWVPEEHPDEVQPPYDPVRTYHLTDLPKTIIIEEGVGACALEGVLYKIDADGFTKIELVEDALELVDGQMQPCTVNEVLCTVSHGQFLFETNKGMILSYNNCLNMREVTVEGSIGNSPYFFKTHYGKVSSLFPNDIDYPYVPKVNIQPLTIDTISFDLTTPLLGEKYYESIKITGGVPPYTLVHSEGELPLGLTLDTENFVITGTPENLGGYWFQVKVTDSSTPVANRIPVYQDYTLNVEDPYGEQLLIQGVGTNSSLTLPQGGLLMFYYHKLNASGGKPPYSWSWTGVPGFTLDAATGEIHGTPAVMGEYLPKITVTDTHLPQNSTSIFATLSVRISLNPLDARG